MHRVEPWKTSNARRMRNAPTEAEYKLWHGLSRIRPRFTRQLPIGAFFADLACRQAKLIVEVDGGQHGERIEEDAARTRILELAGWQVLRVWNGDVLSNVDGVVMLIVETLTARLGYQPDAIPSRAGRERNSRFG